MKPNRLDRREFLRHTAWLGAALPILGALGGFGTALSACNDGGSDTPPNGEAPAKEDEAVAASLGYRQDATKVDVAKFPKRAGAEGEKQFCKNCQFFTAKGDSGWGTCQIIRTGDVKATGWCNTWALKAGA